MSRTACNCLTCQSVCPLSLSTKGVGSLWGTRSTAIGLLREWRCSPSYFLSCFSLRTVGLTPRVTTHGRRIYKVLPLSFPILTSLGVHLENDRGTKYGLYNLLKCALQLTSSDIRTLATLDVRPGPQIVSTSPCRSSLDP